MSIEDRPAKTWGRGTPALNDDHFRRAIQTCRSAEHLARAIAAERNRPPGYDTRPERIERLTDRLEDVQ